MDAASPEDWKLLVEQAGWMETQITIELRVPVARADFCIYREVTKCVVNFSNWFIAVMVAGSERTPPSSMSKNRNETLKGGRWGGGSGG